MISGQVNEVWFEQAILAADYLLRAQRPGGLIDLRSVNIDSSPDTSIMLQLELKGLASGGSDIGDFLQKSIIGYEQESLPHAP